MMKVFLITLITSFFLGMTNTSMAESVFTFAHKASNDEAVYIFLQNKISQMEKNKYETLEKYKLEPHECLEITTSQFDSLIVKVGIRLGFSDGPKKTLTTNKTICGSSEENKCQPNHYEIIDEGDFLDDYVMTTAEKPDPRQDCPNISVWMDSKNNKEVLEEPVMEKNTSMPEEPYTVDDDVNVVDDPINYDYDENKPQFTIIHTANSDENIFIFLQDILPKKEKVLAHHQFIQKYKLEPYECLKITASQFESLFIKVGVAGMKSASSVNKPLCGSSEETKCQPNHYEIIDNENRSDYIMNPTNQPNDSKGCMNIAVWMSIKNTTPKKPRTSNNNPSTSNSIVNDDWVDSYDRHEPAFTITHQANANENVFIFLQKRKPENQKIVDYYKNLHKYKVKPYECLEITENQFNYLTIKVGIGFRIPLEKSICSNLYNKPCEPNNYEIIDIGEGILSNYIMNPIDQSNTNKDCTNIAEWMDSKNTENP